ncbi:MAG: hypothetical protein ACM3PX_10475 [Omnitrophica WOR_2 bacterium]|jgi:hypothetical protein
MAEIKIEKRKPIWPWVLAGLVVVALVGYYLLSDNNNRSNRHESAYNTTNDQTKMRTDRAKIGTDKEKRTNIGIQNQKPVAAFINYVNSDIEHKDLNHEKVSKAFEQLTAATNEVANETGHKSIANIDKVKMHVGMIEKNQSDTAVARNIKESAEILSAELQQLQKDKFPDLNKEARKLKNSSESIKTGKPALQQSDEIKSFLADAADLLEKMD